MAVLQYKDPITGQMVDLPVASYGIKDAPKDGKQYVRQDGEWTSLSIEPSSPFANQEYADIVVNSAGNGVISSDDYNKLFSWAVPVDEVYPYAETLHQGFVTRMNIANTDEGIYAYTQMTYIAVNTPLYTISYLIEIKSDLTVSIKEQREFALDTSGDGTRFLANDGEYKEIDLSNADEVFISKGVEPTGNQEVWIDLSDDSVDEVLGKQTVVTNYTVDQWSESTTYEGYPYQAAIPLQGVTSSDYVEIVYDLVQAVSGNYAPVCNTTEGSVTIYAKVNDSIVIPTIIIHR